MRRTIGKTFVNHTSRVTLMKKMLPLKSKTWEVMRNLLNHSFIILIFFLLFGSVVAIRVIWANLITNPRARNPFSFVKFSFFLISLIKYQTRSVVFYNQMYNTHAA
ncbi:hypothetical protein AMTRI_Chr07g31050 [Amborella trichopoda]